MRRFHLAVLGGTFDHLHVGHHALLATAFRVGREVAIGVTTDEFVARTPKPEPRHIQPYRVRRAVLVRWIRRSFPGRAYRVVPLENAFGRSVEPEVDVLVVSQDTRAGGRAVNRERRRLGRRAVPIVTVPLVLGDDLAPVSSRRVRSGIIDQDGRRRAPLRAKIVAEESADRDPARHALRRVFPDVRFDSSPAGARHRSVPPEIVLEIRRHPPLGWRVVERTPNVRLGPRAVPGHRPEDLERGLVALLRPR